MRIAGTNILRAILLALCLSLPCTLAANELSAEEFLAEIRRPLAQDVWGEITGRITHQRTGQSRLNGELRLRVSFSSSSLHAQITLNDKSIYGFEQHHPVGEPVNCKLNLPEPETKPGLFDFGLEPEDLSFSFIYWDFIEELPAQKNRSRTCRVMRLAHPGNKSQVEVWFDAEYGFPLLAKWFKEDGHTLWRSLEMKGAKKHQNGLWFVKEMRLDGEDWKTRVIFDFASLKDIGSQ
ncbi:MAG: hypothetical protein GX946_01125 [Oligosphaeraceae bacterium]|mgnify:FL=1|nr:hypothetical protein [Oligosphaeraceae bacterium]